MLGGQEDEGEETEGLKRLVLVGLISVPFSPRLI